MKKLSSVLLVDDDSTNNFLNELLFQSLGVTERTVERQWAFAKAWMFRSIQTQL